MISKWRFVSLGELVKIQGGYAYKSKDFIKSGVPVAKIKNVKHQEIDLADCGFVSDEIANSTSNYFIKNGDVLICMTGSGMNAPNSIVGRVARHIGVDNEFLINQRVGRFDISDESKLDKKFLYYIMSPRQKQWELVAIATGSANQVNISGKQIESLDIPLPPLQEQKQIAHILGTLDDKIELNRKMNETLEAMAQAMFKSWFVDFDPVMDNALSCGKEIPEALLAKAEKRKAVLESSKYKKLPQSILDLFPCSFVWNEELEKWIPEGWDVKTVEDVAKVVGGGTPSTKVEEYYCESETGISWLSPKDLSGYHWKFISNGATDITELGLQKSSAKLMPKGTVLFSSRAPIGYIAIAGKEVSTNQGFKSLVPNENISSEFLYQFLKENTEGIESIASGSTFKEVSGSAIKGFDILIPSLEIMQKYDDLSAINHHKFQLLQNETDNLVKQRDTLLPKLISGETNTLNKNYA